MTIDEIRELIKVVTETSVAELEVQRGENRVRIVRSPAGSVQHFVVPGVTAPFAAPVAVHAVTDAPAVEVDAGLVAVKSPIVGTFYEAPSPGAPPFVKVGDTVHPGQVLCIIESMKLMNEIEADVAGVISSKLASNGQPVEYGEALFTIRRS
ncbi:MAG: acetyl-CoA carboxylase biotin carboxyl carrier protein [Bryobacterales bacterium]|nr:acetyl-CoA carboxylase biotin carboxyl carrier protein [Bryobacterales bacterium]